MPNASSPLSVAMAGRYPIADRPLDWLSSAASVASTPTRGASDPGSRVAGRTISPVGIKLACRWGRLPLWRRGLAVLLTAGATALIAALVVGDLRDARVRRSGLHAVASVLDVADPPKGSTTADVRFRTRAGDIVTATIEVDDVAVLPQAGDEIDVRYRYDDPVATAVTADVSRRQYWTNRLLVVPVVVISSALPALFAAGLSPRRPRASQWPRSALQASALGPHTGHTHRPE